MRFWCPSFGVVALALLASPTLARASPIDDARAAIERCPTLSVYAALSERYAAAEQDMGSHTEAKRVGEGWLLTYGDGGMGRWAVYSETRALLDARCRVAMLARGSQASERVESGWLYHEGDGSEALVEVLLLHASLTRGHADHRLHAFGRAMMGRAGEWVSGKPSAQIETYWPDDDVDPRDMALATPPAGARMIWIASPSVAPTRWQHHGRYELWRADEGPRFRRGREALVVYDRERIRHAWVLATPLAPEHEGRMSYLGHVGDRFYVGVDVGGMAPTLVAVDAAAGEAETVGAIEAVEGGRVRYTAGPGEAKPQVIELDAAAARGRR